LNPANHKKEGFMQKFYRKSKSFPRLDTQFLQESCEFLLEFLMILMK
jgi:hypothetical protein